MREEAATEEPASASQTAAAADAWPAPAGDAWPPATDDGWPERRPHARSLVSMFGTAEAATETPDAAPVHDAEEAAASTAAPAG